MSLWKWFYGQKDQQLGPTNQANRLKSRMSLPNFSSLRGRRSLDQVPFFPVPSHSKAHTFTTLRNLTLRRRGRVPSIAPDVANSLSGCSVKLSPALDPKILAEIDTSPAFDPGKAFELKQDSPYQLDVLEEGLEASWLGETKAREFPLKRQTLIASKPHKVCFQTKISTLPDHLEDFINQNPTDFRNRARVSRLSPPESGYESDDDDSEHETCGEFVTTKLQFPDQSAQESFGGIVGPMRILTVRNGPAENSSDDGSRRELKGINRRTSTRNGLEHKIQLDSTSLQTKSALRSSPIPQTTTFEQGLMDLSNTIVRSHRSGEIREDLPFNTAKAPKDLSIHDPILSSCVSFKDDFKERQARRKRKYLDIFDGISADEDENHSITKSPWLFQDSETSYTGDIINDPARQLSDPRKIYEAGYNAFAEMKSSGDDGGLGELEADVSLGEISILSRSRRLLPTLKTQSWRQRATKLIDNMLAVSPSKQWATEKFLPKRDQRGSIPSFGATDLTEENHTLNQENRITNAQGNRGQRRHVREEAERGSPPAYLENSSPTAPVRRNVAEAVVDSHDVKFVAAMLPKFYSSGAI